MLPSGGKKKNSKPSYERDSRIISNGERVRRSINDSDGVNPELRARSLETLALGRVTRDNLSRAMAMNGSLGGSTTANVASTLNADVDDISRDSDDDVYDLDDDYVPRGLFRGTVPRVALHAPSVAISWTAYEMAMDWLLWAHQKCKIYIMICACSLCILEKL